MELPKYNIRCASIPGDHTFIEFGKNGDVIYEPKYKPVLTYDNGKDKRYINYIFPRFRNELKKKIVQAIGDKYLVVANK